MSSAPTRCTAAVKIEPQPPHSPSDLGAGDGSSSHGVESSTHVGDIPMSEQGRRFEFDDDESPESDEDNFSHRDTLEDGEYVDDVVEHTGDDLSERFAARSDSFIHDLMARTTRAVEEVRIDAARPLDRQPAHRASSPATLSSQLSHELAGATRNRRALNGGNRSVRSNSGTQHVYKVLKPSINPLRRKPLLVNGGVPTHK